MKDLIYAIHAVESRRDFVEETLKQIPNAIVYYDEFGDAMKSYLYICENIIGDKPCVFLEDDIILTDGFVEKVESVIEEHPDMLINFFSLSKKFLEPHYKKGSQFCMNQCVYFPKGFGTKVANSYEDWVKWDKGKNPTACDFLVGYAWGLNNDYLVWQPSLIQHRECKSMINSRRSTKRQSVTFVK